MIKNAHPSLCMGGVWNSGIQIHHWAPGENSSVKTSPRYRVCVGGELLHTHTDVHGEEKIYEKD